MPTHTTMTPLYPTLMTTYQQRLNASQRTEIAKVSGRNGAEAFPLPPDSSILLLDEQDPIVWLKTTDSGGYPKIVPYSITPYEEEKAPDTKALESRIERLEAAIIGKSDTENAKPRSAKSKSDSSAG